MYSGIEITPPFFEIGPKAYIFGKEALKLAIHADKISEKYNVQIIFTPQYVDIPIISHETKNLLIFAQHMDSLPIGRGIGSVLPEALKADGAVGVLLNHAEKRLQLSELIRTVNRADEVGLATLVCADTIEESAEIARLQPNIVLAESPELIGIGIRGDEDMKMIERVNHVVWEINPQIRVLHGAGIKCGQDVYDIIAAGAQATGSTSGIILAKDPLAMVEEMIKAVREAWDDTHKK
jgi:triosephosphate isomerase (TIM)